MCKVRLCARQSECSSWTKSKNLQSPTFFQKHWCYQKQYWGINKDISERDDWLKQLLRKMISSFNLIIGTAITPFFYFYLDLGLQCTKSSRFLQITLRKVFNGFVQSVVSARRANDENTHSRNVRKNLKTISRNLPTYQLKPTNYLITLGNLFPILLLRLWTEYSTAQINKISVHFACSEITSFRTVLIWSFIKLDQGTTLYSN